MFKSYSAYLILMIHTARTLFQFFFCQKSSQQYVHFNFSLKVKVRNCFLKIFRIRKTCILRHAGGFQNLVGTSLCGRHNPPLDWKRVMISTKEPHVPIRTGVHDVIKDAFFLTILKLLNSVERCQLGQKTSLTQYFISLCYGLT